MEIWKDVKGYEGLYQISDLGRVKSFYNNREVVLKNNIGSQGYLSVGLHKNKKQKTILIHQIVAIAFLGHKSCGHKKIVDHRDNNKKNNKASNLQITTTRYNCSKDRKKEGLYTGVHLDKGRWVSQIQVKAKKIYLGRFESEIEASLYYDNALKQILNGTPEKIVVKIKKMSSKYKGVSYIKEYDSWRAQIKINGKSIYLGSFKEEVKASEAYQKAINKSI